jgi:hypothetical protein
MTRRTPEEALERVQSSQTAKKYGKGYGQKVWRSLGLSLGFSVNTQQEHAICFACAGCSQYRRWTEAGVDELETLKDVIAHIQQCPQRSRLMETEPPGELEGQVPERVGFVITERGSYAMVDLDQPLPAGVVDSNPIMTERFP